MSAHRRPSRPGGGVGRLRVSVLTAATAAALSGAPAVVSGLVGSAAAKPGDDAGDAQARVQDLYAQAERATEKYNDAKERTDELRRRAERLQERAARDLERVNRMRSSLGGVAGAQYRAGGIDPSLTLMLSEDPDGYLDKAATLERIGSLQAGRLQELLAAQRGLGRQRVEAKDALAELERSRAELTRHKRAVAARLARAQRIVNSLPQAERPGAADRASRSGSGPGLTGSAVPASGRAALAVAAAREAVGAPYVWGGAGPDGFDCSGLTQWAYGRAGVSIPRTSQGQRYAGRQVPLGDARPGDLVTYRDDASHVAMYMGDGQVVHAPYPGAQVRYDPVGMMPVAAVTRP